MDVGMAELFAVWVICVSDGVQSSYFAAEDLRAPGGDSLLNWLHT